jgi:hypothetical protein
MLGRILRASCREVKGEFFTQVDSPKDARQNRLDKDIIRTVLEAHPWN